MVDITPAAMDLLTPDIGTPELEMTDLETTITIVVDDLLRPEGTQEKDTRTETAMTIDHPAITVEAEAKVRDGTVCRILAGHQVGR